MANPVGAEQSQPKVETSSGTYRTVSARTRLKVALSLVGLSLLLGCTNNAADPSRQADLLTQCKANLKSTATAVQSYAVDNANSYPSSLGQLVPKYLAQVPSCPCAFDSNYSASYQSNPKSAAFSLYCKGAYHASQGLANDYPRYHSQTGLLER